MRMWRATPRERASTTRQSPYRAWIAWRRSRWSALIPSPHALGRGATVMKAAELDAELLREAERTEPALAGPMRVLSARRGASGRTLYSVSARRLVPVDEQDAALHGISIALPVACEVEVGP